MNLTFVVKYVSCFYKPFIYFVKFNMRLLTTNVLLSLIIDVLLNFSIDMFY